MSHRSFEGSITKLGDRHFRVRMTVGYDDDGRQVRASQTVHGTRRDAEAALDRMKRQRGAGAVVYGRMSVYDFVKDEWLASRRLRDTTLRGYKATLENHIKPAFRSVKMKDLTALHIIRALNAIESRGAALNVYKMMRSALNLAVRSQIIEHNPIDAVDKPEPEDYEADVYTLAELTRMLEWVRGESCEAGIIIAATCGTRASETCALDWRDIRLERTPEGFTGSVDVHKGYHRLPGQRLTTPTKTKRSSRVVALPAFAVERLMELRGLGPLMVDRTGQRMTPEGLSQRWRRIMLPREGYTPPVRFIPLKNLRHSRATILLDLGASMRDVSLSMGHVNERTTSGYYDRPERAADQGLADILDTAKRRTAGA